MIKVSIFTSLLITCFTLIGCNSQTEQAPKTETTELPKTLDTSSHTINTNSLQIFLNAAKDSFKQLADSSIALQNAITDFANSPSPSLLNRAKSVLLETHKRYMLIQVFQQIDIPHPEFDLSQNQPSVIHPLYIRLDQYPIIPGYLDAVPNYPSSGLAFSEQEISPEYLNNEHQFTDSAYVAIGFHALEFMLTGGLNQTPQERSIEFEALTDMTEEVTPKYRRSHYIQLLAAQIKEDIHKLSAAWLTKDGFYPQTLHELLPSESTRLIQQAYKMEKHALSQLKEHAKNNLHPEEIDERKKQLLLLKSLPVTKEALEQTSP